MTVFSTVHVAFKALLRNPTRAMLTTLGIVIGIAAVITMMEIGTGSSNSIRESIEKMGANSVMIIPGAVHTDLYDRTDIIPFDKLEEFFDEYLK